MIIKSQVLSEVSSLSVKKLQGVPCVIQNGNKLRNSNSVTSDAKKTKETLMTRLSGNTVTETKTLVKLEKFAW